MALSLQHTKKTFTLNSGDKIPAIGLGTWQSAPDEVERAVEYALRTGYRHIDTALAYGNEADVGRGIKNAGVPRDQIWLTTKLNNSWHKRVKDGIDTAEVFGHRLHWDYVKMCAEMQKLVGTGKVRNIGVANFGIAHLERLLEDPSCKIIPAVNQIELHPNNPSPKLVAYNSSKGIHTTGYSCLGSTNSPLYTHDKLNQIAKEKERTVQQILLVWGIKHGWSVIPKSVTKARIEANFELDGWDLIEEEMKAIDFLPERFKACGDRWLPSDVRVFFEDDE